MGFFLICPILIIFVVSFWDYTEFSLVPDFVFTNYIELFESSVTYSIYLNTLKFAAWTWLLTLVIGFGVAHFLAFHVRSLSWQVILFLICTIPFWTSNIIRMIAWIPVLGRHGLVNKALINLGLVDQPLEWLLFSDFAVILAFVHLYTLFMVVPIFNSMMRIDTSILEAARDAGASSLQILVHIIVPLCRPGIAIGTIFVISLVMGDFITVQAMSGGQSASVPGKDESACALGLMLKEASHNWASKNIDAANKKNAIVSTTLSARDRITSKIMSETTGTEAKRQVAQHFLQQQ